MENNIGGIHLYRKTSVEVNLSHIQNNVSKIINKYSNYQYYFGVIKANCYGHEQAVEAILAGGVNYLAVALLEEALEIRKRFPKIPILCLGVITSNEVELCIQNQITITINSLETARELLQVDCRTLKVHLKLNTGMNRLGISSLEELKKVMALLEKHHIVIEGIYSHIYDAKNKVRTEKQLLKFQNWITNIEYQKIPIIHIAASEALTHYPKLEWINGCRLGIIMYGFTDDKSLNLESTFTLSSEIIQIQNLKKGETASYNGTYIAKGKEKIAIVPIGYADGISRKNTGRNVYIKGKPYPIVGNICMDMLFVKIDNQVKIRDKVVLLKDNLHIEEVATYLDTIPYEIMCMISARVPRIYVY